MDHYYSAVILLSWMTLSVLSILVWENDRLRREEKRLLYLSYGLVALAALAEWLGLYISGKPDYPAWLLRAVKCADYILTPMTGGSVVAQLRVGSYRRRLLMGVLVFNTAFQLLSAFTGWMIVLDGQNNYTKGPLYGVYMAVYILVILLTILEFRFYGRGFRRQNRRSLYAILFLVIVGVLTQEFWSGKPRTAYITLTVGMALLFIHNTEYSQLSADDQLQEQLIRVTTDALTGLKSRYAYAKALRELDDLERLPEKLAAFSMDVNGLKAVNDSLGHAAGDELICGAAECIRSVLGPWGECYRTGGDEFIVLAEMTREQAEEALSDLSREAERWRGEKVEALHLAAGFALAADYGELSAEKLIQQADRTMYAAKSRYYRQAGFDRRKSRSGETSAPESGRQ